MRAKLKEIKEGLRKRRHEPPSRQGQWLGQVVQGWFNYHAAPTNIRVLSAFRFNVVDLWRRSLRRLARRTSRHGKGSKVSRVNGCLLPRSSIRGRLTASASNTRGGSRMRESRPYGSERGAFSNGRPYRDRAPTSAMRSRRRSGVAAPGRCSRQPRARSAFRDPFRHLAFAALHGDLGSSLFSGQSIVSMIAQRIPPTPVADDPDPANLRIGRGASGSRRPGAGGQLDRPCGVFPCRIGLFANNATSRSSGEQPTRLSRASG